MDTVNERQPETSAPPAPSGLGRRESEGPAQELPAPPSWGRAMGFLIQCKEASIPREASFPSPSRGWPFVCWSSGWMGRKGGPQGRALPQGKRVQGVQTPRCQSYRGSAVWPRATTHQLSVPQPLQGGELMLSRARRQGGCRVQPGALRSPAPAQGLCRSQACGCCWKTAFHPQKCHSIQKGDCAGMFSHCDDWHATGLACTGMLPL